MSKESSSRLTNWGGKYGALVIALSCLLSAVTTWGDNWILTTFLVIVVLTCGTIGFFDIRRAIKKGN